jgi:hypothetical protein
MKPRTRTSLTTLIILCQRFLIPAAAGIAAAALVEYLVFEVVFQELKAQWGDLSLIAVAPVFLFVAGITRQSTLKHGNRMLLDLWKDHRDEVPEGFTVIIGEPDWSPAEKEERTGKEGDK